MRALRGTALGVEGGQPIEAWSMLSLTHRSATSSPKANYALGRLMKHAAHESKSQMVHRNAPLRSVSRAPQTSQTWLPMPACVSKVN